MKNYSWQQLVLVTALTLTSSFSVAGGWTEPLQVTSAFVEDSDVLIVYTQGGRQYSTNCSVNAWNLPMTNEGRKNRAWATVMTAIASGKKIKLWYQDACGVWGYHSGTAVMILNE